MAMIDRRINLSRIVRACFHSVQAGFTRVLGVALLSFVCLGMHGFIDGAAAESQTPLERAFRSIDRNREQDARAAIRAIGDPLLRKTMTWFLLTELNGAGTTGEIDDFLDANPDWPRRSRLQRRAEELIPKTWPAENVLAWFKERPPVSDVGRARVAMALLQSGHRRAGVAAARKIWREGNFSKNDERYFYRVFRKDLKSEDNIARLDRLLWEGWYSASRRMFSRVPKGIRKLDEARFQLRHRRGNVDKAIARVPDELKNDEGLVYERLRWRRRKGRTDSALELMLDPKLSLTHSALWAEERIYLSRRSLEEGNVSVAYSLVDNHGVSHNDAVLYSEAEWYAGWIALRFLKENEWAYDHFRDFYRAVSYPISRARGAYWSGRAAEALGKAKQAKTWYGVAADYPETYYGQLAIARHDPQGKLNLPEEREYDDKTVAALEGNELARACRILVGNGFRNRVRPLVLGLSALHDNQAWQHVAARFARSLGRPDLAIRIAKNVRRDSDLLIDSAFPTLASLGLSIKGDRPSGPEPALVHAVIRQESGFFIGARSPAGAVGLMQVMPRTARLLAKRHKMHYSRKALINDPKVNLAFGRIYLSDLLDMFDGSYLLTLAAYNAGPSNVRRWIREFGDPRSADVDPIDWIEMIPFDETRNYVQRILENLQVYRAILSTRPRPLQIAKDLRR